MTYIHPRTNSGEGQVIKRKTGYAIRYRVDKTRITVLCFGPEEAELISKLRPSKEQLLKIKTAGIVISKLRINEMKILDDYLTDAKQFVLTAKLEKEKQFKEKEKERKRANSERRKQRMQTQRRLCDLCLLRTSEHFEHATPLSRGGLDEPENIITTCSPCNLSKGSKTVLEFLKLLPPKLNGTSRGSWLRWKRITTGMGFTVTGSGPD